MFVSRKIRSAPIVAIHLFPTEREVVWPALDVQRRKVSKRIFIGGALPRLPLRMHHDGQLNFAWLDVVGELERDPPIICNGDFQVEIAHRAPQCTEPSMAPGAVTPRAY